MGLHSLDCGSHAYSNSSAVTPSLCLPPSFPPFLPPFPPHLLPPSLPPLLCSIFTSLPQDAPFLEDQTLTCDDFQCLSDTQELSNPSNFYSSSSPLSQLESPLTTEQQQQPLCPGAPCGGQLPLPAACPVVPFIPWPAGNPLYGMLSCCGVHCISLHVMPPQQQVYVFSSP